MLPDCRQQQAQAVAYAFIVIDDENRLFIVHLETLFLPPEE
jgi:hypothetical protein